MQSVQVHTYLGLQVENVSQNDQIKLHEQMINKNINQNKVQTYWLEPYTKYSLQTHIKSLIVCCIAIIEAYTNKNCNIL